MTDVRLALGTAQLGMDYGIANPGGRPSTDQIDRILRAALDLDVDCIDTAAAYGEAETVIGRFLTDAGRRERIRVCTKVPKFPSGLTRSVLRRDRQAAVPGAGPWLARFREVCPAHRVESADQLHGVSKALRGRLPAGLVRDLDERFEGVPAVVRDPRRRRGAA